MCLFISVYQNTVIDSSVEMKCILIHEYNSNCFTIKTIICSKQKVFKKHNNFGIFPSFNNHVDKLCLLFAPRVGTTNISITTANTAAILKLSIVKDKKTQVTNIDSGPHRYYYLNAK